MESQWWTIVDRNIRKFLRAKGSKSTVDRFKIYSKSKGAKNRHLKKKKKKAVLMKGERSDQIHLNPKRRAFPLA